MLKATATWFIGSKLQASFLQYLTNAQMLNGKPCTEMLSYVMSVLHLPCMALYRSAQSSVWCNSLAKLPVSF